MYCWNHAGYELHSKISFTFLSVTLLTMLLQHKRCWLIIFFHTIAKVSCAMSQDNIVYWITIWVRQDLNFYTDNESRKVNIKEIS